MVSRATLVVCAVSLVGQWVDEAMSKSAGSLRILSVSKAPSSPPLLLALTLSFLDSSAPCSQYHGQKREQDFKKISLGYDLVVTTYETLGSDYGQTLKGEGDKGKRRGQGHPLGDIHWHRIVFDEGHMVKSGEIDEAQCMISCSRCLSSPPSSDTLCGYLHLVAVCIPPDCTLLLSPRSCCSEGQGLCPAELPFEVVLHRYPDRE